jgi:uncharacterized protein YodC (DUF2158 family)
MTKLYFWQRWFNKLPDDDPLPVGTLVYLKSGSPLMTVGGTNRDGTLGCFWIDNNNQYHMNAWKQMLEIKSGPTP